MSAASVKAHFVEFYSPGTFVAETTVKPIDAWDVGTAVAMAAGIVERYGARPYAFRFLTRERGPHDLDSHVSERSGTYYLAGTVRTIEDVERDADPSERILLSNMRNNDWTRIVEGHSPWKWTQPLHENDVVLEPAPALQSEERDTNG